MTIPLRIPPLVRLTTLLITIIAVSLFCPMEAAAQFCGPTCCYPPMAAATNGAGWPEGAHVKVYINSTGFTTLDEQGAVKRAFNNWQSSNSTAGSGSGVTFEFVITSTPPTAGVPPNANNVYVVNRGPSSGGGLTNIGHNSGGTKHATTSIDPELVDPNLIADTMAHEIGHTFGLDDCNNSCVTGGSIMGARTCEGSLLMAECLASSKKATHGVYPGLQGPTPCDNSSVKLFAGYDCTDIDADGCTNCAGDSDDYNPAIGCGVVEDVRPRYTCGGGYWVIYEHYLCDVYTWSCDFMYAEPPFFVGPLCVE